MFVIAWSRISDSVSFNLAAISLTVATTVLDAFFALGEGRPMEVVYLLWHLQLIAILGRVGGGSVTSAAIRDLSSEVQWAQYDFNTFGLSSSWKPPGDCEPASINPAHDFLALIERLCNCAFVLVLASGARLVLRAILSWKLNRKGFVIPKAEMPIEVSMEGEERKTLQEDFEVRFIVSC